MNEGFDEEVEAIRSVLNALAPLSETARANVLDYVKHRLGGEPLLGSSPGPASKPAIQESPSPATETGVPAMHIKQFKDEKSPSSANEMAAVAAYYLANYAPTNQRKATVGAADIETQFKIAGFRLPQRLRDTLPNAKKAGYFDFVGDGQYKLNAVGHNLVVHSLPRANPTRATTGAVRQKGKTRRRTTTQRSRTQ